MDEPPAQQRRASAAGLAMVMSVFFIATMLIRAVFHPDNLLLATIPGGCIGALAGIAAFRILGGTRRP